MAYGGRGAHGQNPYGQQNPYDQPPPRNQYNEIPGNSFDSGSRPAPAYTPYGSNPYQTGNSQSSYGKTQVTQLQGRPQQARPAAAMIRSDNDVEMGQLNAPAQNPQAILDECSLISEGAATIDKLLSQLESAHRRALNDTVTDTSSPAVREINTLNADIMAQYKANIERMKWIKSRPESGSSMNQRQIGLVDRKLKATYQRYLQVGNDYEKRMREQMARQYRITKPDASEDEVRQACEDTSQQVFSQALLRSDRRGESRAVLSSVRDRHEAIQKIEKQMEQLAIMFQDMERMVVEQEPLIQQIEHGAEETHVNVVQGNEQLAVATVTARSTRRKKWICFWISILLLIIIAIILGVVIWWFTRPISAR